MKGFHHHHKCCRRGPKKTQRFCSPRGAETLVDHHGPGHHKRSCYPQPPCHREPWHHRCFLNSIHKERPYHHRHFQHKPIHHGPIPHGPIDHGTNRDGPIDHGTNRDGHRHASHGIKRKGPRGHGCGFYEEKHQDRRFCYQGPSSDMVNCDLGLPVRVRARTV